MTAPPSDPTASVVIPAFNAAETIVSTVHSALTQTETALEVVVVNDGSTDDTAEIVGRIDDPRIRLVNQANQGLPAARNAGIRASQGAYVAFLDSDDLLLPDFLHLGIEALQRMVRPGFAYTDAYVLDDATGRVRTTSAMAQFKPPTPPPKDSADFLLALMRVNFVYVSTIVPRDVLEATGGFNETLTSCEDYDLWLRILVDGHQAAWVPGQPCRLPATSGPDDPECHADGAQPEHGVRRAFARLDALRTSSRLSGAAPPTGAPERPHFLAAASARA